jgi:hypothetical protein
VDNHQQLSEEEVIGKLAQMGYDEDDLRENKTFLMDVSNEHFEYHSKSRMWTQRS